MSNALDFNTRGHTPDDVVEQIKAVAASGASTRITKDELSFIAGVVAELVSEKEELEARVKELEELAEEDPSPLELGVDE